MTALPYPTANVFQIHVRLLDVSLGELLDQITYMYDASPLAPADLIDRAKAAVIEAWIEDLETRIRERWSARDYIAWEREHFGKGADLLWEHRKSVGPDYDADAAVRNWRLNAEELRKSSR